MNTARMPTPEGVIRNEVSTKLIFTSLIAAFCLNLLPWQGITPIIRPDFLLIVLVYWCMEEPQHIGATSAFIAGLLIDITESSFIGQNALIYSLTAYLSLKFRLRILSFSWGLQAVHIFLILLVGEVLFTLEQLIFSAPIPPAIYFLRSILGLALWPIISWLLELPRRQQARDQIK